MRHQELMTCTLVQSNGTNTLALFSTKIFDQIGPVGKTSKGVSVRVVTLLLLTLRLSSVASKEVPAAPAFPGHPILSPPDATQDKEGCLEINPKNKKVIHYESEKFACITKYCLYMEMRNMNHGPQI